MRVAFIDDDPNELKILHTYFKKARLNWTRFLEPVAKRNLP